MEKELIMVKNGVVFCSEGYVPDPLGVYMCFRAFDHGLIHERNRVLVRDSPGEGFIRVGIEHYTNACDLVLNGIAIAIDGTLMNWVGEYFAGARYLYYSVEDAN